MLGASTGTAEADAPLPLSQAKERRADRRKLSPPGSFAGLERRHRNQGRAEQHRVDGVEIAAGPLENVRERRAVVT
jgi:hypothetical protein